MTCSSISFRKCQSLLLTIRWSEHYRPHCQSLLQSVYSTLSSRLNIETRIEVFGSHENQVRVTFYVRRNVDGMPVLRNSFDCQDLLFEMDQSREGLNCTSFPLPKKTFYSENSRSTFSVLFCEFQKKTTRTALHDFQHAFVESDGFVEN